MPHVQVRHKPLDLYFEHLDPESRKLLYQDLMAGHTIQAPDFPPDHSNTINDFNWNDLDLTDKHKIEKLMLSEEPNKPIFKYNAQTRSYEKITGKIVEAYLKMAGYDREKLKPGYKARFVIHSHAAEKAGLHYDLRLEFPVMSLHKALGSYEGKRIPGTREPLDKYPNGPGTVFRSFAVKKHTLPTADKKLFIVETEDHPISYGSFHGTIESGYGKGEVDIFDKGTFELLNVDGDKKYTIDFKGKKLNGIYALIKYNQGYLWVKVKEKQASAIDYVRPTMAPDLWLLKDIPELLPSIKTEILRTFIGACDGVISHPSGWVDGLYISGSSTGYNYQENGDVDIDIIYTADKFKQCNPAYKILTNTEIFELLKKTIYKVNHSSVGNTSHTYSFMVLEEGDKPCGDAVYDILKSKWISPPVQLPFDFDPDEAFAKERQIADKIASNLDHLIGEIVRTADQFKKINQFVRIYGKYHERRVVTFAKLKMLCNELDRFHTVINSLTEEAKSSCEPIYPAFKIGPNWDSRQIVFKYLARSGYHRPVHILYTLLGDDPVKGLINKIIPD
jgi:DNA polymerase Ligase (LigD)